MSKAATERTAPHALEAERAVLGACLVNDQLFPRAAELVRPASFYRDAHRRMFAAMATLDQAKRPIDLVTLRDELTRAGDLEAVGGPAYMASVTDGIPRTANIAHYAAIVRDHAIRRAAIAAANAILADAYESELSVDDLVSRADSRVLDLQRGRETADLQTLGETSGALYADLERRAESKGAVTGIPSGIATLDGLTFGFQRGEMAILAARTSVGKSAFALNVATHAAQQGHRVALFSLEMSRQQLEYRILSALSGVALTRVTSGYLEAAEYDRLATAMAAMAALPIAISDRGTPTVWDLRAACRRRKAEHGLDLIVVDYVQLIVGSLDKRGATRNEEMTDISHRLKALAKEVDAAVLVLSQLRRSEGRPHLADLRESGSLEQDADVVAFLHRKDHRLSGKTRLLLDKQRNGQTGTVIVNFERDTQTFTDGGEDVTESTPAEEPAPEPAPKQRSIWTRRKRG